MHGQVFPSRAAEPLHKRAITLADGQLWGYELLPQRLDGEVFLYLSEEESASAAEAGDPCLTLRRVLDRGLCAVLPYEKYTILQELNFIAPPVQVALRVMAHQSPLSPTELSRLQLHKSQGHILIVDTGGVGWAQKPLLQMADIVAVDPTAMPAERLSSVCSELSRLDALKMAKRVNSLSALKMLSSLGFTHFCGTAHKAPVRRPNARLTAQESARLNIFNIIEKPNPDFDALAQSIQSDVAVSYKLMLHLNSAHFGLPQKVQSIRHAITLLGWSRVKTWLRVLLLADMAATPHKNELLCLAVQRGKFLELLAKQHPSLRLDPGEMFLLGAFSLLDAILGVPLQDILAKLPLRGRLQQALLGETDSIYWQLLHTAKMFEENNWTIQQVERLQLEHEKLTLIQFVASGWTDRFIEAMPKVA